MRRPMAPIMVPLSVDAEVAKYDEIILLMPAFASRAFHCCIIADGFLADIAIVDKLTKC